MVTMEWFPTYLLGMGSDWPFGCPHSGGRVPTNKFEVAQYQNVHLLTGNDRAHRRSRQAGED
jgi:hypothetical protein